LDQKYVTYAVNASAKNQLKTYRWKFPIIGSVPYKGYFKKEKAVAEAKGLAAKNLDTYVRGVSAYSTLGWFEDPLLSSMLRMKEHQFVNTLIHETVHASLYIKSESKFNERVASFLGQLGAEAYYKKLNRSEELRTVIANETHDELLFSKFISDEIKNLRQWYKDHQGDPDLLVKREQQFAKIKQNFQDQLQGQLKTKNYDWFPKKKFNNAFLLLLGLYNSDFSVLDQLANHYNRDFVKTFNRLKELEDVANPEQALEQMVSKLSQK
jgi:predicted aminopeptidase